MEYRQRFVRVVWVVALVFVGVILAVRQHAGTLFRVFAWGALPLLGVVFTIYYRRLEHATGFDRLFLAVFWILAALVAVMAAV